MIAQKTLIFDAIYKSLQDIKIIDKDRIFYLFRHYIGFACTDDQALQLKNALLNADPLLSHHKLTDNDLQWEIVKKVFGIN